MSDVLVACDEDGLIEETNAALCELVGRSEAGTARHAGARTCWPTQQSVQRWQLAMYHAASRDAAVVELNLRDARASRCRWT